MPRRRLLESPAGARLAISLTLVALLTACSSRPFVVQPPEDVGDNLSAQPATEEPVSVHDYDPNPRPLSFCYSSQMNTPEEVMARAREQCPNNGTLQFAEEDFLFNGCALFQPYRVTFICTPGPRPDTPYD